MVKDCFVDDKNNRVVFVVKEGDMGIAIGKKGINISRVRKMMGRGIEVVEHSDDAVEFVKNLFSLARIKNVSLANKKGKNIAIVEVDERDKGLAIGRDGCNILKAKVLAKRHHGIDDIMVK